MDLELLVKDTYSVYVVVLGDKDRDCAHFFSDEWKAPNTRDKKAHNALLAQIDRLAKNPISMAKPFHKITKDIWQLQSYHYRIPWFYDKGSVIICTHFFVKKSGKTPKGEKERAERIRKKYLSEKGD